MSYSAVRSETQWLIFLAFVLTCAWAECAAMVEARGGKAAEHFSGSGYLSEPLKLARAEAEECMSFAERGLRKDLSHMLLRVGQDQ